MVCCNPALPPCPAPPPCSDQEAEWQQLERIQQQDADWQRQQAAERERREALCLGQSLRQSLRQSLGNPYLQPHAGAAVDASVGGQQWGLGQEQHQQGQQRGYLERELAALQQQRQADEAAELAQQQQWEEGEDEEERAALQQLPSPLNSATSDLDAAVARLLASAGNTPSGPLCQGVRQAEVFADVQQQQEPGEQQQERARWVWPAGGCCQMSSCPTELPA